MMQEVKITSARIGVIIGKGGVTKKNIEKATQTRIQVDSEEGTVIVEGDNAEAVLRVVEVLNAINRGFSPERAFSLIEDEDLLFDLIDLSGLTDSPRQLDRLRGRIIGRDGRAREQIEHMTGVSISVLGKTVAMIGSPDQIKLARTAIEMLINGVPHETVFSFLERKRREGKQDMLNYYY